MVGYEVVCKTEGLSLLRSLPDTVGLETAPYPLPAKASVFVVPASAGDDLEFKGCGSLLRVFTVLETTEAEVGLLDIVVELLSDSVEGPEVDAVLPVIQVDVKLPDELMEFDGLSMTELEPGSMVMVADLLTSVSVKLESLCVVETVDCVMVDELDASVGAEEVVRSVPALRFVTVWVQAMVSPGEHDPESVQELGGVGGGRRAAVSVVQVATSVERIPDATLVGVTSVKLVALSWP
jgi:hypothetical protein